MLGLYSVYRVTIGGQDVTQFVASTQIFEDVQNPVWSAQLNMLDSVDLLMKLPITAMTPVEITIGTHTNCETDDEQTFEFYVYRIGDKEQQNQKTQVYTVFCATYAFLQDQVIRLSQTWKNQSPTDMIKTVVADNFSKYSLHIHACDNSETIKASNWTPFIAIGFMLKTAHLGSVADYLFFQSDHTEFTCNSIEDMLKDNDTGITLNQRPGGLSADQYGIIYEYCIQKFEWQHADAMGQLQAGVVKSKMVAMDFLTKTWTEKTYSYGDDNSADNNKAELFKDPIFNKAEDSHITFVAKHTGMNGDNDSVMNSADQWLQSRQASIYKIDQEKLIVQIPGSVGTFRWIGKTINVELPSQNDSESMTLDPRSGAFLVTAVVHICDRDQYVVNLELVKRRLDQ